MKIIAIFLIILMPIQLQAAEFFSGKVTEMGETGRGAEYWVQLTDSETQQTLDFNLFNPEPDFDLGYTISVEYQQVEQPLVIGLRLLNSKKSPLSPDTPEHILEQQQYNKIATYVDSEYGDMGVYLHLQDEQQQDHYFMGVYELDIENLADHSGELVEITYILEQKIEILDYHVRDLPNCDEATSQAQISSCAQQAYETADAELNAVYQQVMQTYRTDKAFADKLKSAQRAWLQFRDAHLESKFPAADKQQAYGSMYPSCYNFELTRLTEQRTEQLRSWLAEEEGDGC